MASLTVPAVIAGEQPWCIEVGDSLEVLKSMPDSCVNVVATSPPYFALRDYKVAGQIGLESTPKAYLRKLWAVFDEVKRVLRPHGVCWVNIGDTMSSGGKTGGRDSITDVENKRIGDRGWRSTPGTENGSRLMIPERFALGMQRRGWRLRSVICWAKPSAMPEALGGWAWKRCLVKAESSTMAKPSIEGHRPKLPINGQGFNWEAGAGAAAQWSPCPGCEKCSATGGYVLRRGSWRPTRSWEPIFMFVKSGRYFCDGNSVRSGTGSQDVPKVQHNEDNGLFSQEEGRQDRTMQGLRPCLPQSLYEDSRESGEGERAQPSSFQNRKGTEEDKGLHGVGQDERVSEEMETVSSGEGLRSGLPKKRSKKGGAEKVHSERKGQGNHQQNQQDGEGAREASKVCSQEKVPSARNNKHANRSRVERHKNSAQGQMFLLQEEEAPHDGSCDTAQQGRASRKGKHRSSVQELQLQEAQQGPDAVLAGANLRDVWRISAEPMGAIYVDGKKVDHYACYPQELVRLMLTPALAEKGYCPKCGEPVCRVIEPTPEYAARLGSAFANHADDSAVGRHRTPGKKARTTADYQTLGFRPSCSCPEAAEPIPGICLDPFAGFGTTGLVCRRLGHRFIGIELNSDYAAAARQRIRDDMPLFSGA